MSLSAEMHDLKVMEIKYAKNIALISPEGVRKKLRKSNIYKNGIIIIKEERKVDR
jgi:hypothetical protein